MWRTSPLGFAWTEPSSPHVTLFLTKLELPSHYFFKKKKKTFDDKPAFKKVGMDALKSEL
jgi:hypothetical protein